MATGEFLHVVWSHLYLTPAAGDLYEKIEDFSGAPCEFGVTCGPEIFDIWQVLLRSI
jgi:hypothetical protein